MLRSKRGDGGAKRVHEESDSRLSSNITYPFVLIPFPIRSLSSADPMACFVSALYLIAQKKLPVVEAKKQLSFKYLHLDFTKTGILDYIFDVFSERLKIEKIDFLDWIKKEYNSDILNSSFKSRIEWKRTAVDLMEFSNAKNKIPLLLTYGPGWALRWFRY